MNENFALAPATLIAAALVALIAAGVASFPVRLSAGGTSRAARYVPGLIYLSEVPQSAKRRRALLDTSAVVATTLASVWFSWAYLPAAFVWSALAVACATDVRVYRLPHRLTRLVAASSVVFAAAVSLSLVDTILALGSGLILGVLFFVIALAANGKMGMGDVYLAAGVGVLAGAGWGLSGAFVAFFATSLVSLAVILAALIAGRGHLDKNQRLPFGPHLAVGAVIALVTAVLATRLDGPLWELLAQAVRL